jgi:hypothetical protein
MPRPLTVVPHKRSYRTANLLVARRTLLRREARRQLQPLRSVHEDVARRVLRPIVVSRGILLTLHARQRRGKRRGVCGLSEALRRGVFAHGRSGRLRAERGVGLSVMECCVGLCVRRTTNLLNFLPDWKAACRRVLLKVRSWVQRFGRRHCGGIICVR